MGAELIILHYYYAAATQQSAGTRQLSMSIGISLSIAFLLLCIPL